MKCTYCQTVNDGSKFHPGTCANCGAPMWCEPVPQLLPDWNGTIDFTNPSNPISIATGGMSKRAAWDELDCRNLDDAPPYQDAFSEMVRDPLSFLDFEKARNSLMGGLAKQWKMFGGTCDAH